MSTPLPYAGHESLHPGPDDPLALSEEQHAILHLRADVRRLQETVRHLEAALRTAGRVLQPYIQKAGNGR
jgi:hypothetical protein